jgi:hypothetical protein
MELGRALREGARLAALAVRVAALAAVAACSPLELDLTEGEAGPPDSTTPDVVVPQDATVQDTGSPGTDSAPPSDAPAVDAHADADAGPATIACSKPTDCANYASTPNCDTEAGVCVQCVVPSDCGGGNTPHCVANLCVACSVASDCNDGGAEGGMVCNTNIPRCASLCTGPSMCSQQGLICSSNGYCVECRTSADCQGKSTGQICYVQAGVCGCQQNTPDCPSAQMPYCGPASATGLRFCQQ